MWAMKSRTFWIHLLIIVWLLPCAGCGSDDGRQRAAPAAQEQTDGHSEVAAGIAELEPESKPEPFGTESALRPVTVGVAEPELLYASCARLYSFCRNMEHIGSGADSAQKLLNAANGDSLEDMVARSIALLSDSQRDEWHRAWDQLQAVAKVGGERDVATAFADVLALERRLLGPNSAKVADTADKQASWLEIINDFAGARRARQESLDILVRLFGARHWRADQARLDLEAVPRFERLPPEVAQRIKDLVPMFARHGVLCRQGKFAEAAEHSRETLRLCREIYGTEHPRTGAAACNLAQAFAQSGRMEQAVPFFIEAIDIYCSTFRVPSPLMTSCLNNVAVMHQNQGRLDLAVLYYEVAAALQAMHFGTMEDLYATALNNLGAAHRDLGNLYESAAAYCASLEIRKELAQRAVEASRTDRTYGIVAKIHMLEFGRVWTNLGGVYEEFDVVQAEDFYQKGIELRRGLAGEVPVTARAINGLANLYHRVGDLERCMALLEQALRILEKHSQDDPFAYAIALNDLATVQYDLGEVGSALDSLRTAETMLTARVGVEHPMSLKVMSNAATLAARLGRTSTAESLILQVLNTRGRLFGVTGMPYALALGKSADIQRQLGNLAEARAQCERTLTLVETNIGSHSAEYAVQQSTLARIAWQAGDLDQAESLLRHSLETTRRFIDSVAAAVSDRQHLALVQSLRFRLDEYLSLVPEYPVSDTHVYDAVLKLKGLVFARQRLVRAARSEPSLGPRIAHLQAVVSQIAARSLNPSTDKTSDEPERLVALAEDQERLERELSRGLGPGALRSTTGAEILAALPAETTLIDFLVYSQSSRPGSVDQGAAKAPVEFLIAFVLNSEIGIQKVPLGPVAPVEAAVRQWRKLVQSQRTSQELGSSARELHDLIWKPLAHLATTKRLLISPDGGLNQIPFAAIPVNDTGEFLIESREISVIPVPGLVQELLRKSRSLDESPSLLVMGDIDFDSPRKGAETASPASKTIEAGPAGGEAARISAIGENYRLLTGTQQEMDAIAAVFASRFQEAPLKRLRGREATEGAAREWMPQTRYVHLATHGFFAPSQMPSALASRSSRGLDSISSQEPLEKSSQGGLRPRLGFHPGVLSGIVFAGVNQRSRWMPSAGTLQDDSILTALEAAELDLQDTHLVVVSACETGLGQIAGGEGALGLQRALQMAGASTTITSLWKVDDAATQALMTEFYRRLWEDRMGMLEALRTAQLTMLRHYDPLRQRIETGHPTGARSTPRSSPFFWSGFVLSGDWR